MAASNPNEPRPFVVVKDGKREGASHTTEAEAQEAAKRLKSLTESGGNPSPKVEIKRQING